MTSDDAPNLAVGWPRGRGGIVAGVATAGLLVLTAADLAQHYRLPLGGALALAVARALALALAWLRPTIAVPASLLIAAMTAAVAVPISADEPWPWPVTGVFGHAAVLVVIGTRGASRRMLVLWWGVTQLVGVVAMTLAPERGTWPALLTMAALSLAAVVVADLLRSRGETRRQLAEQEGISAAERAQRARWQERARIARELHDVVAHHLSVVVVRADSAPHRLGDLPDEVRAEFAGIADDARSSLTEMRRVLRLLREEASAPRSTGPEGALGALGALGPQPGIAELDELVASTRRAGADVRLEVDVPAALDPAVELTAYRVVQEAVSNAVRHAPGAPVRITVRVGDGDLRITVANGPPSVNDRSLVDTTGSGHGLVGMRERISLLDGTLRPTPSPDGGYVVEASIPLAKEDHG
ncbi:MAG TPA: sensor histidine kinase [Kribbella sp.]|nr:sensor histidine kinase [Kribbella sp.]